MPKSNIEHDLTASMGDGWLWHAHCSLPFAKHTSKLVNFGGLDCIAGLYRDLHDERIHFGISLN